MHLGVLSWLGVEPPIVPALDLHEIIGEKIRATAQRNRIRDLSVSASSFESGMPLNKFNVPGKLRFIFHLAAF